MESLVHIHCKPTESAKITMLNSFQTGPFRKRDEKKKKKHVGMDRNPLLRGLAAVRVCTLQILQLFKQLEPISNRFSRTCLGKTGSSGKS